MNEERRKRHENWIKEKNEAHLKMLKKVKKNLAKEKEEKEAKLAKRAEAEENFERNRKSWLEADAEKKR